MNVVKNTAASSATIATATVFCGVGITGVSAAGSDGSTLKVGK